MATVLCASCLSDSFVQPLRSLRWLWLEAMCTVFQLALLKKFQGVLRLKNPVCQQLMHKGYPWGPFQCSMVAQRVKAGAQSF